jgi:hypothetical protein
MALMGWGLFNVIEGLIDHHLLGIHHVHPGDGQLAWDLAFLALGWLKSPWVGRRFAQDGRTPHLLVGTIRWGSTVLASRPERRNAAELATTPGSNRSSMCSAASAVEPHWAELEQIQREGYEHFQTRSSRLAQTRPSSRPRLICTPPSLMFDSLPPGRKTKTRGCTDRSSSGSRRD